MSSLDIKQMSTIERLELMERLWDSLLYDESDIKTPDWHGDQTGDVDT